MKNFIQDGKTIEYKVADTAIKSGEVRVIGDLAGVAVTDGAVDETVVLNVTGVYELAKGSGAITQGQKVYLCRRRFWHRGDRYRQQAGGHSLGGRKERQTPRCWSS